MGARSWARRPSVWIAALVVVVVAIAVYLSQRGPKVTTVASARRDLEQHVIASGRVWVPTRVQISAQLPGLVLAVGAVEGQHVRAGDLLVQIDDAEARASVAQAKAAVDQAAARVEQLRRVGSIVATESLRQADANLTHASEDLARIERLATTGAVPQTQLDDARRAMDIARAQKKAAEVQQIASTPLGADSRVALSALLQAQAQLTGATVRLEQARIVARQAGIILTRNVEPGDTVSASKTLLVMAADAEPQIVIEPDERNLAWIRLGQHAKASADAYPQEPFDAEVSYIAPSIDPQRGSIEVRLRVLGKPSFLKPDMTVSVDLTVATKKDVVVVPSDALRGAATPSPFVLLVEKGRLARRDVKIGIRGEGDVEIESGLEPRIEVVAAAPPSLRVGQRVRAEPGER
ncbi:MAG: efflux RND transporter periplasmic adaptor subunit [Deltaproteobacteria bacterium]|nr:efflux RND transporter periplasmic adaptor subunit [Deltaproteobacteria bacterium]